MGRTPSGKAPSQLPAPAVPAVSAKVANLLIQGQNYEMGSNGYPNDLYKALECYEGAGNNPFALFRRYTIVFKLRLMDPSNTTLDKAFKSLHYRAISNGSLQACSDFGVALRHALHVKTKSAAGSGAAASVPTVPASPIKHRRAPLPPMPAHLAKSPSALAAAATAFPAPPSNLDFWDYLEMIHALQWIERHLDRDHTFMHGRVFGDAYVPTVKSLAKKGRLISPYLVAVAKSMNPTTMHTHPYSPGEFNPYMLLGHIVRFMAIKEVFPGFFFAGILANDANCMYEVARGYQFGNCLTPPDLVLASCWYHEAARVALLTGDLHIAVLSLTHLADLYTFGIPSLFVAPNMPLVAVYRASAVQVLKAIESLRQGESDGKAHVDSKLHPVGLFDTHLDPDALAPLPLDFKVPPVAAENQSPMPLPPASQCLDVVAILEQERRTTVPEVAASLYGLLDSILEGILVL
ncbi:hypothetical protein HDU96_008732 [Phlyctochytrium bullatum]|nr:hypothetical protein HDU96_008732 [Phlyctochytrium bullatum]